MKGCRPLNDVEIQKVLSGFTGPYAKRDKALFLLGIKAGFRISELLSLRVGDLLQAGRMVDRVSVARRHMKKKTEGRTVLLHPDAKAALAEWLDELMAVIPISGETFVFLSRKGENRPVSRVHAWRVLHEAFLNQEINGKLGTHSMRKTFANKIYEALGFDLIKTQRALGHRNINSTAQYLAFREEEIERAILAI
jgi:integrase